ncbi:hypothetical protein [Ancylobacter radicis]|uniref:Uncharacterized protein n=1 Tax=Ancylobacter radicis TaxID=2836179 RepID=A0ABS5R1U0_9HYPH|nr:hypothetical protein [Ancylobacter radicis]MBS9475626.1 hypothetical protein [Ancylobacter radicis]
MAEKRPRASRRKPAAPAPVASLMRLPPQVPPRPRGPSTQPLQIRLGMTLSDCVRCHAACSELPKPMRETCRILCSQHCRL